MAYYAKIYLNYNIFNDGKIRYYYASRSTNGLCRLSPMKNICLSISMQRMRKSSHRRNIPVKQKGFEHLEEPVLVHNLEVEDFQIQMYSVESKSLHEHCEQIVCIVATKSVVDLSKLDMPTFMYFYQSHLITAGVEGEELEQELENVRKIYDKFKQSMKD